MINVAKGAKKTKAASPQLELTARESAIRVGGHSRMNPANLKAAGLKSAGPMRVKAGSREILLTVVGDATVGRDEVVIRAPDLLRLKVASGSKVAVTTHELIADTAKRQTREAGRAVQKAAHDTGKAAIRARGRVKQARIRATKRIASGRKRPPKKEGKGVAGASGKRVTSKGRKARKA